MTKICALIGGVCVVCGGWYGGGIGLNLGEKEINHLKKHFKNSLVSNIGIMIFGCDNQ